MKTALSCFLALISLLCVQTAFAQSEIEPSTTSVIEAFNRNWLNYKTEVKQGFSEYESLEDLSLELAQHADGMAAAYFSSSLMSFNEREIFGELMDGFMIDLEGFLLAVDKLKLERSYVIQPIIDAFDSRIESFRSSKEYVASSNQVRREANYGYFYPPLIVGGVVGGYYALMGARWAMGRSFKALQNITEYILSFPFRWRARIQCLTSGCRQLARRTYSKCRRAIRSVDKGQPEKLSPDRSPARVIGSGARWVYGKRHWIIWPAVFSAVTPYILYNGVPDTGLGAKIRSGLGGWIPYKEIRDGYTQEIFYLTELRPKLESEAQSQADSSNP